MGRIQGHAPLAGTNIWRRPAFDRLAPLCESSLGWQVPRGIPTVRYTSLTCRWGAQTKRKACSSVEQVPAAAAAESVGVANTEGPDYGATFGRGCKVAASTVAAVGADSARDDIEEYYDSAEC